MNFFHEIASAPTPRLSLAQYRCLLAVAEARGVTQAAERLGMTQSAVSHQLREAERRLDIALFTRIGKRLRPTPAGERLIAAAREALLLLAQAEGDAGGRGRGIRQIVRIGSGAYSCYRWLPRVLRDFQTAHPDVDVQVVGDSTRSPVEALLAGDIDVAVAAGPLETQAVRTIPLFRDELVLIAAPDHPLARKRRIRAEDLVNETYITYSVTEAKGYECERMMRPARLFPQRMVKVELTEGICELVAAGYGVSILSRWAVAPYVEQGRLKAVRLQDEGLFIDWHASVRRADGEDTPAVRLAETMARAA